MKILITGGCGFIGSHLTRLLVDEGIDVVNIDKLTYAGNLENLKDVKSKSNYRFVQGDICDAEAVSSAMNGAEGVINLAAETHVDRSILNPGAFIQTDVLGTYTLLEEARKQRVKFFLQVSTDEVYGSIDTGEFTEESPLHPNNPYSASKLGADRLAGSYFTTYDLPVVVTRGSNTYGPNQHPEKLISLTSIRAIIGKPIPVYGDGKNVRDWLHAKDHAKGIWTAAQRGVPGEVYNIGGRNERHNIDVVRLILKELNADESLISFVRDREGHDRRYALNDDKIRKTLKWEQEYPEFEKGLAETVAWYNKERAWWEKTLKSNEEFQSYFEEQYGDRLK